jgi:hypothetical protein
MRLGPSRAAGGSAQSFLVEHYRPGITADAFRAAMARVRVSAAAMLRDGSPIRCVHSTPVPEDEAVLSVVDAASSALVEQLFARAGVRVEASSRFSRIEADMTFRPTDSRAVDHHHLPQRSRMCVVDNGSEVTVRWMPALRAATAVLQTFASPAVALVVASVTDAGAATFQVDTTADDASKTTCSDAVPGDHDVTRASRDADLPFDRVSASLWLEPEEG